MKAILEFNLPEEREEFKDAQNGSMYHSVLFEVRDKIFRPARKYGFSDPELQQLFEKLGEDGIELISLLEQKFNELVSEVDDV